MEKHGFAGKIAEKLINSPLVPIILIGALLLGGYGLLVTPREDRPEVEVPTALIMIPFPGAAPELIDELAARPVASWALQLERVEEVRSVSTYDAALVSVEFVTGVSDAEAFSELSDLIAANRENLPPGAGTPVIQTIGDELIATLMVTLSSRNYSGYELRRLAEETGVRLEEVPGVRSIEIYGGQERQVQVYPDLQGLAANDIDLSQVLEAIAASNLRLPGDRLRGDQTYDVQAGAILSSVKDVRRIHVGSGPAGIIYLDDIAVVEDGPAPVESHVLFWGERFLTELPAVSLSVTTVPLENISDINRDVLKKLETLRGVLIPEDVTIHIGYDAGRSATERVLSVLRNLLLATIVVVLIILIGLGRHAALTISMMIPAALSFVPIAYYWLGFTLNPVSISAMILAIGIVSDDSVIMLENTARYYSEEGKRSKEITIKAINEVGNPTILAVLIIIVTMMPMAFISGEMGQFVRVIPIGASIAIFASLCLALTVIPYLAFRLLPAGREPEGAPEEKETEDNEADNNADAIPSGRFAEIYRRTLTPFMNRPILRWLLYLAMVVMLVASLSMIHFRMVQVGLAPLIDHEVFVLDIRLPAGSSLEETVALSSDIGREIRKTPEIIGYTVFAGTRGPDIYPDPQPPDVSPISTNQAYVYVHLTHEDDRRRMSYDIDQQLYDILKPIAAPYEGRIIVRRIPSGPQKTEDIHAEIYGPTAMGRTELAGHVEKLLSEHPATSVTWQSPEKPKPRISLVVDPASASAHGIFAGEVAQAVHVALSGHNATMMHMADQRHPVPVVVRLSAEERESIDHLKGIYLRSATGRMVSLPDLLIQETLEPVSDHHRKNLIPLVYVAAKLDRDINEPLPVQQDISRRMSDAGHHTPDTTEKTGTPEISWFSQPEDSDNYVLHWGGEWDMTQQVYRDLGVAALAALILIYSILTAWFGSYGIPLLIMLPIPLIIIGVIPAHWIWGQNLAGVGIMGIIALAGIVVRNSVLLVDFIKQRRNSGMALGDAIIAAGALRTRPIVLTASTVMLGSGALILEPTLEPLGLTLASGVLVSTVLTLVLIPVLYFHAYHKTEEAELEEVEEVEEVEE